VITSTDILAALGTCVACGCEPAERGSKYGARCTAEAQAMRARIDAQHFTRRDKDRKVRP
jgi:hypothetical protein